MQVCKAVLKTILKQKGTIIMYLGIFLGLAIVLTNIKTNSSETDYAATKINIAVFDYDNSECSRALYDYLDSTQNIISIEDDNEAIADELFFRNVLYVLRINEGFEDDLNNLENVKQTGSVQGQLLDSSIEQYVKILDSCRQAGYTDAETVRLTKTAVSDTIKTDMVSNGSDSTDFNSTNIYYSFIPYIFISILMTCLGYVLSIFRKKEISERIQCSAASIIKRNILMTLISLLFAFVIWLVIIAVSLVLYNDVLFSTSGILYIANSFVFMLVALSMTYLISFLVHTASSLNMVANVLGLGFSFLSGIFVPLQFLNDTVITVAKFLPTYWYVLANNFATDYTGASSQINTYLSYIGIELLFAVAFFCISLAISKMRKTA